MNSYQKNKSTININKKYDFEEEKKIELKNISKSFNDTSILMDISIEVKAGEIVSIIGPSGCGKSTIFNIISRLDFPDSGNISINGEVSYMYQKDLLLPYKNIIDNISLPLIIKGFSKKEARAIALPYFDIFGLSGYINNYPKDLSGGMKQRANFMRTFIHSKDIMLLDEPFGALDSITKRGLIEWFLDIRKKLNPTVLLITHDIDEAVALSDRIYILSNKPTIVKKEIIIGEDFDKNNISLISELKESILKFIE